jgi:hypothetical protein
MSDTLDSVPGNWTLWMRLKDSPTTTVVYQAVFAASGNAVTVTAGGTSYSGTWQEKGAGIKENVTFQLQGFVTPNKESRFTGYMVGLAMGGYIEGILTTPLDSPGNWSAYKTSD